MDENSVSFQMFLILLSFTELGSESQISVFKQSQSSNQMPGFLRRRGGACAEAKLCIWHFPWFNFSRLSIAFILKYYHYRACCEKIIRL